MTRQSTRRVDLAVVGASALFPGSIGGQAFWRNILDGRDFMSDVPPENWLVDDYFDPDPAAPGKIYARRGAFLPKVDFDPVAHGLPPNQLGTTDTAQLLALIVAQKVLEDAASVQFGKVDKRDISVILGVASATELVGQMAARIQRPHWIKALREMGLPESKVQEACARIEATYPEWDESTFPGLLGNVVAGRIANRLNLGGANCVVDAACASSLGAVAMAAQELQLGHSDLVITGGVDALNDVFMFMCFSKTPALSPTGDCRPFSESADGTMLGEGIGMVALRRLEDAERDGDKIYAVLRGIGSSSDGRAKSIYAPRAEGQEVAIRRAYERAGYGPEEVGLVEAHGTATKAGDLAEFEGLRRAFAAVETRQTIALGSIKSQIGHTKAAAGAASLFKTVMALHHKVLPPTIKVDRPNSRLGIEESPFYLNTEARPWVQAPGKTRKASVSSFGFGGSNFHVTLEEYAGQAPRATRVSSAAAHLILLAANDAPALAAAAREVSAQLSTRLLAAVARESQQAFSPAAKLRLAAIAADEESARENLAAAIAQIERKPDQTFSYPNRIHYGVGGERPNVAFLFPGQGSQYLNMGRGLALEFDEARQVWDEAAGLQLDPDHALHQVVFPAPVFSDEAREAQTALLTRTDWAQPAIGGTSLALLRVLQTAGVRPQAVGGHSYGEIVALHAAGVIENAADMLAISRRRGELMRSASAAPGAMLAVRASAAEIEPLIAADGGELTIANVNGPQQVVVGGARDAVEAFQRRLKVQGKTCARLPVATAFHTALVADSAEPFAAFLADRPMAEPKVPVYGNTRAEPYPLKADQIRATLARQLAEPVRFADMVERMYADGCRLFLEVGPGAVLTSMVGDCLAGRPHVAVATDHKKVDGRAALFNALAVLSVNGLQVDYTALWAPFTPVEPAAPATLSPATVKLGGANHGKPYPAGGAAARPAPNAEVVAPAAAAAASTPVIPLTSEPPPAAGLSEGGWAAFQAMQQNLLEAQRTFTETMAASHQAFLRASEASMLQLGGGRALAPVAHPTPQLPVAAASPPPVLSPQARVVAADPGPALQQEVIAPAADATKLLLEVVAEKTGYPVEMLTLDMELEAGLGIDSIKRVQILSALQEKLPELAAVDANALAALNTLGEIVAFAQKTAPPVMMTKAAPPSAAPAVDATRLLLEVVSEKTGYPVEMLSLDMELEAGLGIDSIKRVQILSALQEKLPELAAVDANALAALNTLGEIVAFAQVATPDAQPGGTSAASSEDATKLLLEVVAEKTGYPVEMLSLDMELEAGLGIDSIKRVQILSALQDRMPELATVDANALAALNTLGEIVAFAAQGGASSPASVPQKTPKSAKPALQRLEVEIAEVPAPGLVTPGLLGSDTVWIVGGPSDLGPALALELERAGVHAEPVTTAPADARALILLTAIEPADGAAGQLGLNERVFSELQACAASMAEHGRLLVTVQSTGGDFALSGAGEAAWSAGVAAAAKTAALEWPHVSVRAIDVAQAPAEALAARLANELLSGGVQLEIGLAADGRRLAPQAQLRNDPAAIEAPFQPDGVLLVSGGARGVTAACLEVLLNRTPCKLAILGRTALEDEPAGLEALKTDAELKRGLLERASREGRTLTPAALSADVRGILATRELKANLARLESTGATVRYLAVDVSDGRAVSAAVEQVRRELGPIRGLVHAAGVLADKEIRNKTLEQFRRVFAAKAYGLQHLLEATRADDLTHIVCFSSVAAWRGNIGQVDYAMANEVLNRVCRAERQRRGDRCLVKAIGWGPWAGGMVDAGLEGHFAAMGVALIPLDAGAAFFADEFAGRGGGASEVLFGGGLDAFGAAHEPAESCTFEARFHRSTHGYIASHMIRGKPVAPLVTAHDLAVQAVRQWLPEAEVSGGAEIEVVQGMVLDRFETTGDVFRVECRRTAEHDRIAVRILNAAGAVAYRMEVRLGPAAASEPPQVGDLASWPAGRPAYDGRLFHGPDLHVIERVDGVSDAGISAVLRSRAPAQLGASAPVDLLDGGLQLTSLWAHEHLGQESLPTTIGRILLLRGWPHGEPVRCVAVRQAGGALVNEWTVTFRDAEGALLALMTGVKMHVLPARSETAPGA